MREAKYDWLDSNDFKQKNYIKIKPASPWYFFVPRNTGKIENYLTWKSIPEIFPVNVTGIVTARDGFVIDDNINALRNRIMQFRNLKTKDEFIRTAFHLKDTRGWKLTDARQQLAEDEDWDKYFQKILYRPFDIRDIYYTPKMVDWGRPEFMRHMLQDNLSLIVPRQFKEVFGALVTKNIIGHKTVSAYDINYLFAALSL